MNEPQKVISAAVILVAVTMLLYPPWALYLADATFGRGYSQIWNPPEPSARIDVTTLLVQELVLAGIAALLLRLFRDSAR